MSSHLADRLLAHAGITVRTATEVTALHGDGHLEAITVHTAAPGDDRSDSDQPCRGLFCFVGATPATGWLEDIAVDDDSFVLTGTQLDGALLGATWAGLGWAAARCRSRLASRWSSLSATSGPGR